MRPESILMQGFKGACGPLQWQFYRDLQRPDVAQNRVKRVILRRLAKTAYGDSLGLGRSASDLDQWQRIPLVTYGDLQPWIDRQRSETRSAILTPDRIHFWEPTSGSTGPRKWIPYTAPLITSFSYLFCLWAADILRHGPPLRSGKTYLCISPEILPDSSPGATSPPLSGTDDTDYIHPLLAKWVDLFLVRVGQRFETVEAFRWELALALLRSPDLEVMSLWSPSFLTTQLGFMAQQRVALRSALGGEVAPDRLRLLGADPVPWAEVWPSLRLIS
ncbi:MAG: GH3 family domain-containing protein [Prochlorothrix sp.]